MIKLNYLGKEGFSFLSLFFLLLTLPILTILVKNEVLNFSKAAEEEESLVETFTTEDKPPDGIIIKYKENVKNDEDRVRVVRARGISSEVKDLRFDNLTSIQVPEDKVDFYINELKNDPDIEYVEPDIYFKPYDIPNDPMLSKQWYISKIQAPQAWNITKGSSKVNIAIIDTGVDISHPDLSSKIVKRMNTQKDGPKHGTHVAGIAAAATNNKTGIAGTGRDVGLYVADVGGTQIPLSAVVTAIKWAADNGANVINMSWGGPFGGDSLKNAINYAYSKNVTLIAAAGNTGDNTKFPPAIYENVFSVAATTTGDNLARFSTRGSWVEIGAPGVGILSTVPGGYKSYDGTSMSSPVVAGVAALVKSAFPTYTNKQIYDRLCSTADKVGGEGKAWRCGRVNAYKAVLGGGGTTPTTPPGSSPKPTSQPGPTPTVSPISDSNYQVKINFQGINKKSAPQKIDYKVYNGSSLVNSGTTYSDSDERGVYTVQIPKDKVTSGDYTLFVKGESHLQKKYSVSLTTTVVDLSGKENLVPKAGDADSDNSIDIYDVSRVSRFYTDFSVPVVYTNSTMPAADINKDGFITITDLALLAINWSGLEVSGDK